jgi:acyl-CoA thioesterase
VSENLSAPTDVAGPSFPLQEFLAFAIRQGDRAAETSLTIGPQHLNPNGVIHGGVAFSLMDTAMGAAAMTVVPEGGMCVTIEVQARFHAGASSGVLLAEATILSAGRRVIHLSSRTTDGNGRLIASATGSFAVIEIRTP